MSLLQLSPEANRLRRIAKACAAGELSRREDADVTDLIIEHFAFDAGNNDLGARDIEDEWLHFAFSVYREFPRGTGRPEHSFDNQVAVDAGHIFTTDDFVACAGSALAFLSEET